jgi:hypothetical protein
MDTTHLADTQRTWRPPSNLQRIWSAMDMFFPGSRHNPQFHKLLVGLHDYSPRRPSPLSEGATPNMENILNSLCIETDDRSSCGNQTRKLPWETLTNEMLIRLHYQRVDSKNTSMIFRCDKEAEEFTATFRRVDKLLDGKLACHVINNRSDNVEWEDDGNEEELTETPVVDPALVDGSAADTTTAESDPTDAEDHANPSVSAQPALEQEDEEHAGVTFEDVFAIDT